MYSELCFPEGLITRYLYEWGDCFQSYGSQRMFLLSLRNKDCTLLSYGEDKI